MPEREITSPFKVMGPFAGLDTWHQPREISPRHATVVRNVLLDKGTIQPRPPFEEDARYSGYPPGKVYAGVDWYPPALTGVLHNLVNVLHIGGFLFSSAGAISPVQTRQGTFLFAAGHLYYLDGLNVFRCDGGTWQLAGISPPTTTSGATATDNQIASGLPRPQTGQFLWKVGITGPRTTQLAWATKYQFAFTWYDKARGAESNSAFTGIYNTGPTPNGNEPHPQLQVVWGTPPPNRGVSHVRVYLRNVTADQVSYVLWYEFPVGPGYVLDYIFLPILGNTESGPFVPYLNGVPQYATVGCFYKNRMFYNDVRDPTLLRYSADGYPEHIDNDNDFERLDDDGGQISGMIEDAGQLVVLKERSLWILSGTIFGPTNASVNLGVPRSSIQTVHEVYRTKVVVGCANAAGGNGAIKLGGRVHYNGLDGFYRFDGTVETKVSPQIDPTWREFVGDGSFGQNQAVSYGHDTKRGIVYLVNLSVDNERTKILAYHYNLSGGAGGWTTIAPDLSTDNPSCIIPAIGTQDPNAPLDPGGQAELRPTGLSIAVGTFRVLTYNEIADHLPMPDFEYQSGRMPLVEGRDAHFYAIKWYLGDLDDAGVYQRTIEAGFRTRPRNVAEYKAVELQTRLFVYQNVKEHGSDITLILRRAAGTDARWHKDLSISGFEIDGEPVGQR